MTKAKNKKLAVPVLVIDRPGVNNLNMVRMWKHGRTGEIKVCKWANRELGVGIYNCILWFSSVVVAKDHELL